MEERRVPQLEQDDLEREGRLARKIDRVLLANDDLRRRRNRILMRQSVLKRRVSDVAWRTFLRLEETMTARSATEVLIVARWAFNEGLRAARSERP